MPSAPPNPLIHGRGQKFHDGRHFPAGLPIGRLRPFRRSWLGNENTSAALAAIWGVSAPVPCITGQMQGTMIGRQSGPLCEMKDNLPAKKTRVKPAGATELPWKPGSRSRAPGNDVRPPKPGVALKAVGIIHRLCGGQSDGPVAVIPNVAPDPDYGAGEAGGWGRAPIIWIGGPEAAGCDESSYRHRRVVRCGGWMVGRDGGAGYPSERNQAVSKSTYPKCTVCKWMFRLPPVPSMTPVRKRRRGTGWKRCGRHVVSECDSRGFAGDIVYIPSRTHYICCMDDGSPSPMAGAGAPVPPPLGREY